MFAICRTSPDFLRRLSAAVSALAVAGALSLPAFAQTPQSNGIVHIPQVYSSSASYTSGLNTNELVGNDLVSPLTPHMKAGAQYGGQYGSRYPTYNSTFSRIAFEVGGGMVAPIGNDTHGYETFGWNFTVGAGMNFTKRFGLLGEFMFKRNKIPGATLAQVGTSGGYIGDWSFTVDPIVYQPFTQTVGMYVTGGGGFYHKTTAFTQLVPQTFCYYFCYSGYAPVVVSSFSSNQGGFNGGLGFYWKAFGPDSNAKLYIESRYIWIDSPRPTKTQNGEGTEGLIPLTIGLRF
ncbi:MAG: outer membrane beta-barrel protein [Acidobacteria bacterium]|jgi:hypothetical protein|nr:outer membrane beta-barrel protein [Acidobacteriota bacterium]